MKLTFLIINTTCHQSRMISKRTSLKEGNACQRVIRIYIDISLLTICLQQFGVFIQRNLSVYFLFLGFFIRIQQTLLEQSELQYKKYAFFVHFVLRFNHYPQGKVIFVLVKIVLFRDNISRKIKEKWTNF